MNKAIIISGSLAQDHEFIYPYYRLLEADLEVDVCLLEGKPVKGYLGTTLPPNKDQTVKTIDQVKVEDYKILVLPGGVKAMEKVRQEKKIIDSNTRNEKIKNFFINNSKNLIIGFSIIFILVIGYLSIQEIKKRTKIKLANQFNITTINFKIEDKQPTIDQLTKLIYENDKTYSPLALYFLIDNNLIEDINEINILFDELINNTSLDEEIKNLIIYKKGLFNSDFVSENDLLKILNPIINSESIWKSHSLYLMAEYFYSKNQKQKAKEFFNQVLILPNTNNDIKAESQKRLNRDLGE